MLNIHAVIDFCCGARNPAAISYKEKQIKLAEQFAKHGFKGIKPDTIQKWIERQQIPGRRLVELHIIASKQGKRLNLYKFIETKKKSKNLFG